MCRIFKRSGFFRICTDQQLEDAIAGLIPVISYHFHGTLFFLERSFQVVGWNFDIKPPGMILCSQIISIHLGTGQHVPLQAGLSDSSVHLIENRREELAQMQWKARTDGKTLHL